MFEAYLKKVIKAKIIEYSLFKSFYDVKHIMW